MNKDGSKKTRNFADILYASPLCSLANAGAEEALIAAWAAVFFPLRQTLCCPKYYSSPKVGHDRLFQTNNRLIMNG